MNGTLRFGWALAVAGAMAGCATTANFEKTLNSWVGTPADRLVEKWGPPQSSYRLSDGGEVLQYASQRTAVIPGYTYSTPQTTYQSGSVNVYGGNGGAAYGNYSGLSTTYVQHRTNDIALNLSCVVRFTVDSAGIVRRWNWQGNNCRQ